MKTPSIEINFSKQKSIEILFGNNDTIKFPNKTLAKAFHFKLKRLVKDNVISLSNVQAQVYACYRENYLYFPLNIGYKILSSIQIFDNRLDFVFKKYSHGNGVFVFRALEQLYSSLLNSISIMLEYGQKYKSFALKNQMNALTNILELLEKDFYIKRQDLELCYSPKRKMKVIKLKAAI